MDRGDKMFVAFFGTFIPVMVGLMLLSPFIAPNMLSHDNEKDVLQHMNIALLHSSNIPEGQTIKFRLDEFKVFLQFINMYNVTVIYDVPSQINITPFAQGEAFYFVHNGIIYLYQ